MHKIGRPSIWLHDARKLYKNIIWIVPRLSNACLTWWIHQKVEYCKQWYNVLKVARDKSPAFYRFWVKKLFLLVFYFSLFITFCAQNNIQIKSCALSRKIIWLYNSRTSNFTFKYSFLSLKKQQISVLEFHYLHLDFKNFELTYNNNFDILRFVYTKQILNMR